MPAALEPLTLTVPQVAKVLNVGRNQVYEMVRRGDLPAMRVGRRTLVSRYELEEWVKANGRTTFTGMGES